MCMGAHRSIMKQAQTRHPEKTPRTMDTEHSPATELPGLVREGGGTHETGHAGLNLRKGGRKHLQ